MKTMFSYQKTTKDGLEVTRMGNSVVVIDTTASSCRVYDFNSLVEARHFFSLFTKQRNTRVIRMEITIKL